MKISIGLAQKYWICSGVTEYSDPPLKILAPALILQKIWVPQVNVLPLTQGAEAGLSLGLSLTLEPSDNRAIYPSTFSLNITFLSIFYAKENNFTIFQHIYHL